MPARHTALPPSATNLVALCIDNQPHHFLMDWKGSKIPRGAKVGGVEIGWTQNGLVVGKGSERLGYYARAIEFAGKGHDEHAIVLSTHLDSATNPDGKPCQKVTTAA